MKVRKTKRELQPKKPAPPEDDGKPLPHIPPPPLEGNCYIVADHKSRTTAGALLDGLRAQGFNLRLEGEKLFVSPMSKLSQLQREALKESKDEIIAILLWEAAESTATTETLAAWYQTLERGALTGERAAPVDRVEIGRLSQRAKKRRIVLLDGGNKVVERVLSEPKAEKVHDEIRQLAAAHPGRTIAAEWESERGWLRWLVVEGKS